MPDFAVLIVAAGSGTRAGDGLPKQYRNLGDKPVLRHVVDIFRQFSQADIRVVIDPSHRGLYDRAVAGFDLLEPVTGGTTRQESVRRGLDALGTLPDDFPILIHDAARPFVDKNIILACLDTLKRDPAVTAALPVYDTLRRRDGHLLGEALERQNVVSVQTPQGFHYAVIRKAHDSIAENFTDDTQLVSHMGIRVSTVEGSRRNIKLTTEDDFHMAASSRANIRTGMGYDVHAFGEKSDHIRIGGIDIPHGRKLLGHSDADVVLHAITDAIFGCLCSGDIGSHFPPGNPEFRNMDSALFLKKAIHDLSEAKGYLLHIDTVVICEEPKIGPHREAIRTRVAEICGIETSRVSIKATTSEQLGFTGRREGIAAQAIATVELPA